MRKNWRMRVRGDRRGKITSGTKGKSSKGKDIPKSLDYFNISKFPELQDAYGDKPDKLIIVFGVEDIDLFFQTEYVKWAKSEKGAWKMRSCDGEECTHHVPEVIDGKKFSRGDVHECFKCGTDDCDIPVDDQCKCYTGFSAYVINPELGRLIQFTPYRFQTNSVNSGDNILSELHMVFQQYGTIPKALPFELTVSMMEVQTDKGKNKFPLWNLKAWGTVEQINEFVKRQQLPTNEENSIIADASKLLESKTVPSEQKNEENSGAEAVQTGVKAGEIVEVKDIKKGLSPDNIVSPEGENDEKDEIGVEVNDPYPEQNEGKERPDEPDEGKKEAEEFFEEITGEKPDPPEDILKRRGILSKIELDMNDSKMIVAQMVKIIMEMVNSDKQRARKKLKTYSTFKEDGHYGYESSKDLIAKGDVLVKKTFLRVVNDYRKYWQKIESKEQQGSLL